MDLIGRLKYLCIILRGVPENASIKALDSLESFQVEANRQVVLEPVDAIELNQLFEGFQHVLDQLLVMAGFDAGEKGFKEVALCT